jgi:hypothetical protein
VVVKVVAGWGIFGVVRVLLLVAIAACAPAQAEPPVMDAAPAATAADAGTGQRAAKRRKGKSALEAVMRAQRAKNSAEDLERANKRRRCSEKLRCPTGWWCVRDNGIQVCKQIDDSDIFEPRIRTKPGEEDPLAPLAPP